MAGIFLGGGVKWENSLMFMGGCGLEAENQKGKEVCGRKFIGQKTEVKGFEWKKKGEAEVHKVKILGQDTFVRQGTPQWRGREKTFGGRGNLGGGGNTSQGPFFRRERLTSRVKVESSSYRREGETWGVLWRRVGRKFREQKGSIGTWKKHSSRGSCCVE